MLGDYKISKSCKCVWESDLYIIKSLLKICHLLYTLILCAMLYSGLVEKGKDTYMHDPPMEVEHQTGNKLIT